MSDQSWRDRAISRIRAQGWAKRVDGDMPLRRLGGCCLMLAVYREPRKAEIESALTGKIAELFPRRVRRPWSNHFYALVQFNDHPDTTQADVERLIAETSIP